MSNTSERFENWYWWSNLRELVYLGNTGDTDVVKGNVLVWPPCRSNARVSFILAVVNNLGLRTCLLQLIYGSEAQSESASFPNQYWRVESIKDRQLWGTVLWNLVLKVEIRPTTQAIFCVAVHLFGQAQTSGLRIDLYDCSNIGPIVLAAKRTFAPALRIKLKYERANQSPQKESSRPQTGNDH